MELIAPIITLLGVWGIVWWSIQQTKIRQQISAPDQTKMVLEHWVEDHKLVRTWRGTQQENHPGIAAWAWECSCGNTGSASNATEGKTLGSEANAIERFKEHAKGFREVNKGVINPLRTKLDKVEADFAEYRSKCYCKHANDDLLLLEGKNEHGR